MSTEINLINLMDNMTPFIPNTPRLTAKDYLFDH